MTSNNPVNEPRPATPPVGGTLRFGTWSLSIKDHRLTWSPGLWAIFDRNPDDFDLSLHKAIAWIRADFRPAYLAALERAFALSPDALLDELIVPAVTPSGEERWIRIQGEGRYDEEGRLTQIIGAASEIRLGEEQQFALDNLLNASPDLIAVAGVDGRFRQINHAWKRTLGWESSELLARSYLELVHPDDLEETINRIEEQKRGEPIVAFENRYRCRDGSYRWLEWTTTPALAGTTFAVARDKTLQKSLQLERDRFFDLSIDLLVVAGPDGRFQKANGRWTEIFGWDVDELISRPFLDFVHPDDIAPTLAEFERQMQGKRAIRFENRYRCKDGSYRWLEWTTQPEPDGMVYAVARDVTDRRDTERVLVEAREEAEQANAAKSEFLAAMSHDLRTPLNAILGFSDMMRTKVLGDLGHPKYAEYVSDIFQSGMLLVSLINDILDLSKIEAGKYTLVNEVLDLRDLIMTSLHQLQGMANRSGITLTVEITEDFPQILGDERALIQVMNNLISNAIKFTPSGGAVTVTAELDCDGAIMIRVTDTGVGMTAEAISKAILPFGHIEGERGGRNKSTGLGLALCVNFMKIFGGALDIQSQVHKGTIVTLLFPEERTLLRP